MVKRIPELSPLEWEIMGVIWSLGGRPSVREVLDAAYPGGEKAYTTVQTVMNNLEGKGYLKKEKIGLVNFYRPLRRRGDLVRKEMDRFVDRVFAGSFGALADYLVQSDALDDEKLAELRRMLEEREK